MRNAEADRRRAVHIIYHRANGQEPCEIVPTAWRFGPSDRLGGREEWLLDAYDLQTMQDRTFAVVAILHWTPGTAPQMPAALEAASRA